jgi:hypothetical protein
LRGGGARLFDLLLERAALRVRKRDLLHHAARAVLSGDHIGFGGTTAAGADLAR